MIDEEKSDGKESDEKDSEVSSDCSVLVQHSSKTTHVGISLSERTNDISPNDEKE